VLEVVGRTTVALEVLWPEVIGKLAVTFALLLVVGMAVEVPFVKLANDEVLEVGTDRTELVDEVLHWLVLLDEGTDVLEGSMLLVDEKVGRPVVMLNAVADELPFVHAALVLLTVVKPLVVLELVVETFVEVALFHVQLEVV
jgi:DNA helicase TIP49 (TBP-interacting protein)